MKFLLSENQSDKLVEFVLNREMPQKFSWWKNIKVIEFKRMNMRPRLVMLRGKLTVDEDWAGEQCMKIYDSKIIDFNDEIDPALLSQIVTGDEADDIRDEISHILTFTLGEETFAPSLNHLEIKLQS
jgi:hypothetical protein